MNKEYEQYIHSKEWRLKADALLEKERYKCKVCGGIATDVHHLTYEHFKSEKDEDLVCLCRRCHEKAEEIYEMPMEVGGQNFMAAIRTDAHNLAPLVLDYLLDVRGGGFDALMALRQPEDGKKYWTVLAGAVNALCRKRYSRNCVEDRRVMAMEILTHHTEVICLAQIEHDIRNGVQRDLHEWITGEYERLGKWKAVGDKWGLSNGTMQKLRRDDGTSTGPFLREIVLYYCGLDAVSGISPLNFNCLDEEDVKMLNMMADHMKRTGGTTSGNN